MTTSASTAIELPLAKKRQVLRKKLNEHELKMLDEIGLRVMKSKRVMLISYHDIGTLLNSTRDDNRYGSHFIEQVAEYLPYFSGGTRMLYEYMRFAERFDREWVLGKAAQLQSTTGDPLTVTHWCRLAQIEDKTQREEAVDLTIAKGWNENEMIANLFNKMPPKKARGLRVPDMPSSGLNALAALDAKVKAVSNYHKVLEKGLFGPLRKIAPGKATREISVYAIKTRDHVLQALEDLQGTLAELNAQIDRLGIEGEAAAAPPAAAPAAAPAPAPTKKTKGTVFVEPTKSRRRAVQVGG